MKNKLFILLLVVSCWSLVGTSYALAQQPTEYNLLAPIPLDGPGNNPTETATTATYLPGLFRLLIGIAGGLAVIKIIWGGIRYMSTDAFGEKSEAKGTIENALWGLLLAMSAWLIVYTINPELVKFDLNIPTTPIEEVPIITPGGGMPVTSPSNTVGLTQAQALSQFKSAGINLAGPILLVGIKQKTVDELVNLKRNCTNCEIVVTSATGGAHAAGTCSHANGYKVDLRLNDSLTNYITRNYTQLPNRADGAKMYKASSGAFYAQEGNHWDVVVPCI